jgi:hypothetical protein
LLYDDVKGRVDLASGTRPQNMNWHTDGMPSFLHVAQLALPVWCAGMQQDPNAGRIAYQFMEQPQAASGLILGPLPAVGRTARAPIGIRSSRSDPRREAWKIVVKHSPNKTERQAREIIKTWVKNEVLVQYEYDNPATRKKVIGLRLDPTKRPG